MQYDWDQFYLGMAEYVSRKSKDPSTKVGSAVVDLNQRLVSVGYNGLPRGVPDDPVILADREKKLKLTLHAEDNAIMFAQCDLQGHTIYVWPMPPCSQCAARIAQAGITRVVSIPPTEEQRARWGYDWALADWIYDKAHIKLKLLRRPAESEHECCGRCHPQLELELPA